MNDKVNQSKQPSKVKYQVQHVLGLEVKAYQPSVNDLVNRRFDYLHVEDKGNIVRLGNSDEEFSFYDHAFTETFVGFFESLGEKVISAKISISNPSDTKHVYTKVSLVLNKKQGLHTVQSECMRLSWKSNNVKLTYVPKEPCPYKWHDNNPALN